MKGKKPVQTPVRRNKRKTTETLTKRTTKMQKLHGSIGIQLGKKVNAWVKWQSLIRTNISIFSWVFYMELHNELHHDFIFSFELCVEIMSWVANLCFIFIYFIYDLLIEIYWWSLGFFMAKAHIWMWMYSCDLTRVLVFYTLPVTCFLPIVLISFVTCYLII